MATLLANGVQLVRLLGVITALFLIPMSAVQGQITIGALGNKTFGAAPFPITATASSGLPVTFQSITPAVCGVIGDLVTLMGAGTCSITAADGAGGMDAVTQSFTVQGPHPATTFVAATGPFGTGSHPTSIVEADFNGDGKPDLAIANFGDSTVTVLLGNGSGGFSPTSGSPAAVGVDPVSIAAGDFNGDGRTDLATANLDGTVTVLLGDGVGGFTAGSSPVMLGGSPISIAVGDFGGDGRADLAVADYFGSFVTICPGDGSGVFTASNCSSLLVGPFPTALAVGDFNGDGKSDLVVLNGASFLFPSELGTGAGVSIHLGNSSGVVQGAFPNPVGSLPSSLAVGDFNGDGQLDVAVGNRGDNSVEIFPGDGSGEFLSETSGSTTGANPLALAAGDFNGDGAMDLAVANGGAQDVALLLGAGNGEFSLGLVSAVGTTPASSVAGDFNGDGLLDLAVVNYDGNTVTVLLGSIGLSQAISFSGLEGRSVGDPPFTVSATASSGLPIVFVASPLTVCTVSGDLVTLVGPGICSITATQPGTEKFGAAAPVAQSFTVDQTITFGSVSDKVFGAAPFPIAATASSGLRVAFSSTTPMICTVVGDLVTLTSAGTCSIIATAGGTNVGAVTQSFAVKTPPASITFLPLAGGPFGTGNHPVMIALGDFNGDGRQDLAVANLGDGTVTVLLGNGSGGFTAAPGSPVAVGGGPSSIAVSDFNGDGMMDLAVADSGGTVTVLLGNGSGSFTPAPGSPVGVGGDLSSVAVGDFNGDGIADLAVADYIGGTVTILKGDGSGGFTATVTAPVGAYPVALAIADFDGDGRADVAVLQGAFFPDPVGFGLNSGQVAIHRGDGMGNIQGAIAFPVGSLSSALAVGDFDGNGTFDLAAANRGDDSVTFLTGNGSGGFSTGTFPIGFQPVALAIGDFDGDGKLDLAVANFSNSSVTISLGTGGTWQFPVGTTPAALAAGDFNGDGRMDIAVADYTGNTVRVLLGSAVQATTTVLSTTAPNPVPTGQPVSLTVKVSAPAFPSDTPTGTVVFKDGTSTLGTATLLNGVGTFTANDLSAGAHSLTATYGGDSLNQGSSSSALLLSILGPDDLAVASLASPLVQTGHNLTYLMGVVNLGPTTASQVTLSNPVPPGTTVVSASWVAGSCTLGGGFPQCTGAGRAVSCMVGADKITCNIGTLAPFSLKNPIGAGVALQLHITAPAGTTIRDTATVTGANADAHPGNNSFTVVTKVTK